MGVIIVSSMDIRYKDTPTPKALPDGRAFLYFLTISR
nr:MAG TPA: hypothetical protein [Caudoviricetes sp.]